uniref:Uncharacterized protein n=1 Tax=Arion vulgaris TaxID=1028688 RepID=A0A0B6ZWU5_9EUPU
MRDFSCPRHPFMRARRFFSTKGLFTLLPDNGLFRGDTETTGLPISQNAGG